MTVMKTKRISHALLFFLMLMFSVTLCAQPNLAGDWESELAVGDNVLPLVIHLSEKDGTQLGSLDSPSQGVYRMAMTKVEFDDQKLLFELSNLGIHYEGTLDSESATVVGKFIQGSVFDLTFNRVGDPTFAVSDSSDPDHVTGTWNGLIRIPDNPLAFVIHVSNESGQLTATGDSPDQSAFGIGIDEVSFENGTLTFTIEQLGVRYSGRMVADHSSIIGSFAQGGGEFKLVLGREEVKRELSARPQTPEPPFPYQAEEVSVSNDEAGITLAGTLTRPRDAAPRAVAVMITGSGAQDRDETLFRHKPFLVIADHLTRLGYAVLRMDDRGTGSSTGDFSTATSEDFVTDISAAVDYIYSRDDLVSESGRHRIGLIGHSEGGMIAPMLAAERDDLAFLVLLAGPGVPIHQLLSDQGYLISRATAGEIEGLDEARQRNQALYRAIGALSPETPITEEIRQMMRDNYAANGISDPEQQQIQLDRELETYDSPWFRFFLAYDPARYFSRVSTPLVAINGSVDLQVEVDSNLGGIRRMLESSGHDDYEIIRLDGLNHLFQSSETGATTEYAKLEETFSPRALMAISDWLGKRF